MRTLAGIAVALALVPACHDDGDSSPADVAAEADLPDEAAADADADAPGDVPPGEDAASESVEDVVVPIDDAAGETDDAEDADGHDWPPLPPAPDGTTWSLVWFDEFEGEAIDGTKWEVLGDWERRDGWWIREDAYVDGAGNLVIRTRQDGDRFTSGAVRTMDRFEHVFGYYEARCLLPEQPGHWPAFWIFDPLVGTIGDEGRDGSEIDIMEKAWLEERVNHAIHWDGYGAEHQSLGEQVDFPGLNEGYHTFGLVWTTDEYIFYIDGVETWRTNAGGVSQVPEYIKLTDEIGTWAGDIHDAVLPDHFLVDYVRVYDAV